MTENLDYDRFKWQNEAVDSDTIRRAADKTEVFYAPTGASNDNAEQRLAVYQTLPDKITSPDVIYRFGAWSDDYGRDPEGAYFNAVLAQHTGRRVLAINSPGVHYSKWHKDTGIEAPHTLAMTPDQHGELRKTGRFNRIGEAAMRAGLLAEAHFDLRLAEDDQLPDSDREKTRTLYGSSLAVATLGGATRYALDNLVPFRAVVAEDGANFTEKKVRELGRDFGGENKHLKSYTSQNPEPLRSSDENPVRWVRRTFLEGDSRRANIALARGLARGAFLDTLGDPEGLRGVRVITTRGSHSRVNDPRGHAEVVAALREAGADVNDSTYERQGHGYTLTTQGVVEAIELAA
jgi:hypothetical protein